MCGVKQPDVNIFSDFKILFVIEQTQERLKNNSVIWGYSQTDRKI